MERAFEFVVPEILSNKSFEHASFPLWLLESSFGENR
jgi:hypothetical protein